MTMARKFTRQNLDGEQIFGNIQELLYCFLTGNVPEYPEPAMDTPLLEAAKAPFQQPIGWVKMSKDDQTRLKTVLDVQLKLLGKVLPDLKAIDFADVTDKERLSVSEMAQRLAGMNAVMNTPRGFPTNAETSSNSGETTEAPKGTIWQ